MKVIVRVVSLPALNAVLFAILISSCFFVHDRNKKDTLLKFLLEKCPHNVKILISFCMDYLKSFIIAR